MYYVSVLWGDGGSLVVIVERLIGCGALSIESLGFHGSPLVQCQIFFLAGGIGWGSVHLTFGI